MIMEHRSNEAPMEFEWQTRPPGDTTSPFYQLAMEHERENKKRKWTSDIHALLLVLRIESFLTARYMCRPV